MRTEINIRLQKELIMFGKTTRLVILSILLSESMIVFSAESPPIIEGPFSRNTARLLQQRAAKYHDTKIYKTIKLDNSIDIEFALIPQGKLDNGKEYVFGGNDIVKGIIVERAFYISKTDLSGLQLNAIMGKAIVSENSERVSLESLDPNIVIQLESRLEQSKRLRLANEMEWDYVLRATDSRDLKEKTSLHSHYTLKNGFGVLLPGLKMNRGIRLIKEIRPEMRGRFYCVAKGTVEIYLNGVRISEQFHGGGPKQADQVSSELILTEGDIVAIRFSSPYAFRSWRMIFVGADRKSYIPIGISDIKNVVDKDVADLNAEIVHNENNTAKKGRVANVLPPRWNRLNVPSDGSDWIGSADKNVWYLHALVIKQEMFRKANNRIMPGR